MEIRDTKNGSELTLAVIGRLDTVTAPSLDKYITDAVDSIDSLILDFGELEYISSAGLRVLLKAHKVMSRKGGMVVKNVNEIVQEVFDITGFADILTIE